VTISALVTGGLTNSAGTTVHLLLTPETSHHAWTLRGDAMVLDHYTHVNDDGKAVAASLLLSCCYIIIIITISDSSFA